MTAPEGGWIEWSGGGAPVDLKSHVDVRLRDDVLAYRVSAVQP